MKKVTIIGLLIIGLIFQNCKNKKTQPAVLSNDDTETVIEKKVETIKVKDTVEIEEKISSTQKTKERIKSVTKSVKVTKIEEAVSEENVEENVEEDVDQVVEKAVETEKEISKVVKETEPIIEKKVEETVTKPVVQNVEETKKAVEPIVEEIKTVVSPNKWVVPAKYLTMKNPTDPKVDLAIGKSLYSKHCKSCHGSEGYGDGPKADEMKGDLGDFSTEQFQVQSDGALFYKTTFGKDDMPEYTKKIPDDEDRWLLVNFMRTLKEE